MIFPLHDNIFSPKHTSDCPLLLIQVDHVFAEGDLDEVRKAVEAIEVAGLEAAEAREKLTRAEKNFEEALKKVMNTGHS